MIIKKKWLAIKIEIMKINMIFFSFYFLLKIVSIILSQLFCPIFNEFRKLKFLITLFFVLNAIMAMGAVCRGYRNSDVSI